jgi:hypothetical protein
MKIITTSIVIPNIMQPIHAYIHRISPPLGGDVELVVGYNRKQHDVVGR